MNKNDIDILAWLQDWYASQCDGMWEQDKRIQISTLDNPGWRVLININDTFLMGKDVTMKKIINNDDHWLNYWVKDNLFEAVGGSRNLSDILHIFRRWVEQGVI